jgi:hypothetical protein
MAAGNCTVAQNAGAQGGSGSPVEGQPGTGCDGGGFFNTSLLTITSCTITTNRAYHGGGVYVYSANPAQSFALQNSVVAGNSAAFEYLEQEIDGSVTSTNGHNFTSGDPLLAPIGDYGGLTQTIPPLPGSPLLDAGIRDPDLLVDQRGLFRTSDTPDLGAFEHQGASDTLLIWSYDTDGDGKSFGLEHALGSDPQTPDPNQHGSPDIDLDEAGNPRITFGRNPDAIEATLWVIKRSTDLKSFVEIFRYDGSAPVALPNIDSSILHSSIQITDRDPPAGRTYYIFESPVPE